MTNVTETKTCPLCAETIKAAARKCPYCQSRQGWTIPFKEFALAIHGSSTLLLAVAVSGAALLHVLASRLTNPVGREFVQHREELQVLQASLTYLTNGSIRMIPAESSVRYSSIVRSNEAAGVKVERYGRAMKTSNRRDFWLSGYLTNCGSRPWLVTKFDARFLDTDGNILDAAQPYSEEGFVVQPQGKQSFRVKLYGMAFTNAAVTCQVRVLSASYPHP